MVTQSAEMEMHSATNLRRVTLPLPRMASPAVKQPVEVRSAEKYANRVVAHAEITMEHSLYAGQNYKSIADYLQRPDPSHNQANGSPCLTCQQRFVSLHDLSLAENDSARIQHFESVGDFEKTCDEKRKQAKPSLILFLKGHPSPQWLNSIGWKCNLDPEFLMRHLDFKWSSIETNYFTLPSLPSSSSNIIRFRTTSVGCRQHDEHSDQSEIERLRKLAAAKMRDYTTNLKRENCVQTGDSIVRSFAVHDQSHFTLDQDISLCVNEFGSGWLATVWLDNGNDLMEGPTGPWSSNFLRSQSWKTSINPTILHRPRIALKTSYITPQPSHQHRPPGKFPQSASLLHSHYGRFLNRDTAINDPFYALSEIIAFVASSESQFLNMVEQKVVSEMERSLDADELAAREGSHSSTLSNLIYNKKILDEHIRRLKENITSLSSHGSPKWPKAIEEKQRTKATEAATTLHKDYEYLLGRAETLSKSCDRGMDIAGNNAMVADSRRSFQQARRVSKLTFLAFLYLPASLTTSIFGMNFKQFGSGNKSIWIWFVLLAPTYIFSLLLLYYDVWGMCKRVYRTFHNFAEMILA